MKPYLKSIMGGRDNSIEGIQVWLSGHGVLSSGWSVLKNGLTHCFVIQLESAKDREYYVEKDPAHKDFMNSVEGIVEQFVGVDFTHGIYWLERMRMKYNEVLSDIVLAQNKKLAIKYPADGNFILLTHL